MSAVLEISDTNFKEEVLGAPGLTLVYFWASWCGPCRLVSPSVAALAQTYGDRLKVVKLEVDPNPEAVAYCKVEGVPALRLFQGEKILQAHEGAISKPQLQAWLDNFL